MNTQEYLKQMKRIALTRILIFRLERRLRNGEGYGTSWRWDFERALVRERFHLRVEIDTLRRMQDGTPHRTAYYRALKNENPSIRG